MDGEYSTKLERLRAADNPSLMVMRYDRGQMSVTDCSWYRSISSRPRLSRPERWRDTLFLREEGLAARGWLIEVMRCVERIGRPNSRSMMFTRSSAPCPALSRQQQCPPENPPAAASAAGRRLARVRGRGRYRFAPDDERTSHARKHRTGHAHASHQTCGHSI
jgi:hypothetical protein